MGAEKKVEVPKAGQHSGAGGWGGCSPSRAVAARDRMETEGVGTQDYIWGRQYGAVKELLALEVSTPGQGSL